MHPRTICLSALLLACEPEPPISRTQPPQPARSASAAQGDAGAIAAGPVSAVIAGVHVLVEHKLGADARSPAPVVIAIHGLGDTPHNFAGLLATFDAPARVVYPRGLSPHGRGFSWFGRGGSRVPGIRAAAAKLAAMIDALATRYPMRDKPVVTGFSQGGMLAYALAVGHSDKIAAAIPLAGALPTEMVPAQAPQAAPPIFGLHGDADPVLPIAPTRSLTQLLRARGFDAELTEYPGVRHTVSPAMHRALLRRLRDHVQSKSHEE